MLSSLLKALLLFGLLGPPLGGIVLVGQVWWDSASVDIGLLAVLPLAYIFGFTPALATGLVGWLLRYRIVRWLGVLLCGVAGAIASTLHFLATDDGPLDVDTMLGFATYPGALAGLACGLIYYWPPNNSIKPNLLRKSAYLGR